MIISGAYRQKETNKGKRHGEYGMRKRNQGQVFFHIAIIKFRDVIAQYNIPETDSKLIIFITI
jgi:hypothetical protein